jgi:mycothiol synthase
LFEQTLRRAHEMGQAHGHTEITVDAGIYRVDELLRTLLSNGVFIASTTTMLEIDGRAVTIRECSDDFIASENCGYIGRLGSLRRHAAARRSGTILHVDTISPTPALGLYLSVGMSATLSIDVWRRILPVE